MINVTFLSENESKVMHKPSSQKIFFGILAACLMMGCFSHYTTTTDKTEAKTNVHSFERGKNLAFNICGQCHYDQSINRFIGKPMYDLPGFMGEVFSANLTHSSVYGILTKYTDAELAYLLKTGIARDGRYIPYMIRPNLGDSDINDITVYLRSGDTAVMATDKIAGKTDVNLLGKMATKIAGKPLPYKKGVTVPKEEDTLAYGKYLIDNLACYHCHSKSILGLDYMEPEKSKGYMKGGMKFNTPQDGKIYAANLTPDKRTGIGNFTKEDFRKAVIKGIRPSGDSLRLPMQKFKHLTNKQADAIYRYLQNLPPAKNKVKR